jgi:hypothetical protein
LCQIDIFAFGKSFYQMLGNISGTNNNHFNHWTKLAKKNKNQYPMSTIEFQKEIAIHLPFGTLNFGLN